MDKQSKAEKALDVLKKNLNIWDMIELIGLLSHEADKVTQKQMMETFKELK